MTTTKKQNQNKYRFTEEVRPVVANELANRATPGRIMDRLWGSLAEWLLLGDPVPAGTAPSSELDDERQFRRRAKTALADAWVDEAASQLRDFQRDIPQYTTAAYWSGRPEARAFLQTDLSLLRLFSAGFRRIQQESELEVEPVPVAPIRPSPNGKDPEAADTPHARWQSFVNEVLS